MKTKLGGRLAESETGARANTLATQVQLNYDSRSKHVRLRQCKLDLCVYIDVCIASAPTSALCGSATKLGSTHA